jgi:hypothetical protein
MTVVIVDEGKSILNLVLKKLSENSISIDDDGMFILQIICDNADQRVSRYEESKVITRRLSKVAHKGKRVLLIRNTAILKKIGERERLAALKLSLSLIENADNNFLNTNIIIRTLKKLCPLWPFCR